MKESLNRQQAILKLDQFHSQLSQHLKQLTATQPPKPKHNCIIIYNPKTIDSSVQTVFDRPQIHGIFNPMQRKEDTQQLRAKRNQELKDIVQVNFKQYFRAAKQKESELQGQLQELQYINQHLQTQCTDKDQQISQLHQQVSQSNQQISQLNQQISQLNQKTSHLHQKISSSQQHISTQLEQLTKQNAAISKQHLADLATIKNLQKGIEQFHQQVKRLTTLLNDNEALIQRQQEKMRELQTGYKNSQHLVDVLSKEQTQLSAKMSKLEKELQYKSDSAKRMEDLYVAGERERASLQKQIDYFVVESQSYEGRFKELTEEVIVQQKFISLYEKMYAESRGQLYVQNAQVLTNERNNKTDSQNNNTDSQHNDTDSQHENTDSQHQDGLTVNSLILAHWQNYLQADQAHKQVQEHSWEKLLEATVSYEKSLLQAILLQQTIQKKQLQRQLTLSKAKHQHFVTLLLPFLQTQPSFDAQSSSSYQSLSPQPTHQHQSTPEPQPQSIPQAQTPSSYQQTPHLLLNEHQLSHKQNQLRIHDQERIVSEFLQEEEFHLSQVNSKNKLLPLKTHERPPSFGKDTEDLLPSESQTSTPNFTQISVTDSNVNSETNDKNDLSRTNLHCQIPSNIQRSQTHPDPSPTQNLNFKIAKSQKVSELICPMIEKSKTSEEKLNCQNIAIQTTNHPTKQQTHQIDKNPPESKQAYCQVKEQSPTEITQREKQGTIFIKKHESLTHWNGSQQLSPTNHKEQSDCPLLIDKKKNAKKKLEYKLPPLQRSKTALNDLEKQATHIQTHNIIYRNKQKDKNHKFLACTKLTDRLSELIQKQSILQLQLTTLEQQQHYQSLGTLGSSSPKETESQNSHLFMIEELEVMGEVQKIIHDTYDWVTIIERYHKREFEKNDRMGGRVRLKKMKTGVNHHSKFRQKQSNEDCYETDRFFECQKQKSVYSEGDSPPGVGEIDHFDISPFDHIEVQQKHEANHSLQKLFKQGQEISQISSVKNQSQVSQFINSRSEFVKMFDAHHFMRVEEDQMHPNVASAYQDPIELHSPNNFYQGVAGLAYNTLANKPNQHFNVHELASHDSIAHNHVKFEDNSIKSLRNICSKEKEKVKMLEKKVAEVTVMYKKFIQKLVEDDKRKTMKMQKDFNRALSMAINLKEPIMNGHPSSFPSNAKQSQSSNPSTSIKLLPQSQQRPLIPGLKTGASKLQSKSLTQITLMSQKISQKDEIVEEKMQAFEKNIDELTMRVEELKANISGKAQQIEELEKKNKAEKVESQKAEKRLQEQRRQVQQLKAQNKKIKNEFSQFMSRLVRDEKHSNPMIKFSKKSSYDEHIKVMKDIEMQVPQMIHFAQVLNKQQAHSISPPSDGSADRKEELKEEQMIVEPVRNDGNEVVYAAVVEEGEILKSVKQEISEVPNQVIDQQQFNENAIEKFKQQIDSLLEQVASKEQIITQLREKIQNQQNQITHLNQQFNTHQQQTTQLNDQLDLITIQLAQKQVQFNQVQNSLHSMTNFQKRLETKLQEAQQKVLELQSQLKKTKPPSPSTPIKTSSPVIPKQHYSTPILQLSQQGNQLPVESNSKPNRGSMGSVEENFFDLETDNEFNNIDPQNDKDLRILQLEKQLNQTAKKLQQELAQNQKIKQKVKRQLRFQL